MRPANPAGPVKNEEHVHRDGSRSRTCLSSSFSVSLLLRVDPVSPSSPSPDLIRTVTDAIVAEVTAWQSRPLEPLYAVVFFDALRVKIRDEATVRIKAVYLALGVLPDGSDILGIWIEQTEGAKFWMKVFTDLKTRGCQDILIAVTDGLKGMEEALAAVFSRTTLQTCIVHLLRQSLDFANWKQRKPLAVALRGSFRSSRFRRRFVA
jgi:putative transposase